MQLPRGDSDEQGALDKVLPRGRRGVVEGRKRGKTASKMKNEKKRKK
jgi:hypothetical protein